MSTVGADGFDPGTGNARDTPDRGRRRSTALVVLAIALILFVAVVAVVATLIATKEGTIVTLNQAAPPTSGAQPGLGEPCAQQQVSDYFDVPEDTAPTAEAALARARRDAEDQRDRQNAAPYEDDFYPGYAADVARAQVETYQGLSRNEEESTDRRVVYTSERDGAVKARVVVEQGNYGWMVTHEFWEVPDEVCDRLEQRRREMRPGARGS